MSQINRRHLRGLMHVNATGARAADAAQVPTRPHRPPAPAADQLIGAQRFGRDSWRRLRGEAAALLRSGQGPAALRFALGLLTLLALLNGLNVINSYVGRDFMSAIANRNARLFVHQAWLYVGVFALSTIAAVLCRNLEERLGLLWRNWQTRRLLQQYLAQRVYQRIEASHGLQNPDQRIAEDVRSFTTSTLSFALMMLNASITLVAFSGVLWSISPKLFLVAVAYALGGSLVTIALGRRMVRLNSQQLDREANLRSELLHLRENAEAIALQQREADIYARLRQRLDQLVANTLRLISIHRNVGFFTSGYNYLIQIVPALIVAPLYFRGQVEFGVVTQSAMAFSQLMGAFSLLVTQFESISSYAAVIGRLGHLVDAMEDAPAATGAAAQQDHDLAIEYRGLTLHGPQGETLLNALRLRIDRGTRLLVTSDSGHAKIALLRATAGLATSDEGTVITPPAKDLMFVPERPYLPHGSLREILSAQASSDAELQRVLRDLGLEALDSGPAALDLEADWSSRLGIREQALLMMARVLLAKPAFVFIDRMSVALDPPHIARTLQTFTDAGISYVVLGREAPVAAQFNARLHIAADGSWTLNTLRPRPASVPAAR
ncbi:MAG TPA: ABC transporter transmembrane domain-containing protein [Nevskiaceae bacterium]|nr:ABC transporter transmembrane domain-containing protein [Nevskiaceae bacterium]